METTTSTIIRPGAELLLQQLLTKYPTSDKIGEAAYWLGDIYESNAFKQYRRAAVYFECSFQRNPTTQFDSRLRAARIYDKRIPERGRAMELYKEVTTHETDQKGIEEANKRLKGREAEASNCFATACGLATALSRLRLARVRLLLQRLLRCHKETFMTKPLANRFAEYASNSSTAICRARRSRGQAALHRLVRHRRRRHGRRRLRHRPPLCPARAGQPRRQPARRRHAAASSGPRSSTACSSATSTSTTPTCRWSRPTPATTSPPCWRSARSAGASGKDLITAAVLAYEIQCRLCDAASLRKHGVDHVTYGAISSLRRRLQAAGARRRRRRRTPSASPASATSPCGRRAPAS